ncbi:hypothetical protein MTO96_014853 [Rhipicephalus appendiculatus]
MWRARARSLIGPGAVCHAVNFDKRAAETPLTCFSPSSYGYEENRREKASRTLGSIFPVFLLMAAETRRRCRRVCGESREAKEGLHLIGQCRRSKSAEAIDVTGLVVFHSAPVDTRHFPAPIKLERRKQSNPKDETA